MVTDRQASLLSTLIREYVASAEPVASEHIVRKYRLPFSSATVRNELQALEDEGFLMQPHTSAGRIPTDQGYRFFINNLSGEDELHDREERLMEEIPKFSEPAEFMKQVSRVLAGLTGNLVITGFPDEALYYKSGISEVMQEPEFMDHSNMHEFSRLMDLLEDAIDKHLAPRAIEVPQAFIGNENPIRAARHYAMIISRCETPFEKQTVVTLVGPKRMDYEHNMAVLKYFRELLER